MDYLLPWKVIQTSRDLSIEEVVGEICHFQMRRLAQTRDVSTWIPDDFRQNIYLNN